MIMDIQKLTDEQLQQALQDVQNANAVMHQQLSLSATRLDPAGVVMTRLNAFIECALDTRTQMEFELTFEHKMKAVLNAALADVRTREIVSGVRTAGLGNAAAPGKLIIPGQ